MTRVDKERQKRSILSNREFKQLLAQARVNDVEFLRIRNPAILCTLKITGKRRNEIAALKFSDVWLDNEYLYFSFILLKKHKKTPPIKTRKTRVDGPLSDPIVKYREFLETIDPPPFPFWPRVRTYFGNAHSIDYNNGITGRSIYNVVRDAGDAAKVNVWPHLFRETVGGNVVMRDSSLAGISKVMSRLDIHERTAWNYMDRYVRNEMIQDYDDEEDDQND